MGRGWSEGGRLGAAGAARRGADLGWGPLTPARFCARRLLGSMEADWRLNARSWVGLGGKGRDGVGESEPEWEG